MDAGVISGIVTAVLIAVFIGICVWAYSARRKKDFDEAARLPLESEREDDRHE